ncbi:sugar ABC transporter permease, partial [Rhizobium brockwellii]
MTILTGNAEARRRLQPDGHGVLRKIWEHRADYSYVLPAFAVMLIVRAYPIYYT